LTVDNSTAAQYQDITITGVKNNVGPAGEDAVTEVTREVFVPASQQSFTHDADGNLTGDARWSYVWDGENRLSAVETSQVAANAGAPRRRIEFSYDGQSRRVRKQVFEWSVVGSQWSLVSSLRFVYDGWNLLAELDSLSTLTLTRSYAWGLDLSGSMQGAGGVGGLLFAEVHSPSSILLAPAFDGNGNIIGYVDMTTGAKSATCEYGAFGETLIADGPAAELFPFRFSTKYTCSVSGLIYYGYRDYRPEIGRWLSRDPIEEQGGFNLYAYVRNNPINAIDPLGRDAIYLLDTDNVAAAGQGHGGALIGNDTRGWTYYSFAPQVGPNSTVKNYKTLADAVKDSEISRYEKFLHFNTSQQEDNRAKLRAGELFDKNYRPFARNCGHIAGEIIKAAKPSFKVDSWRPKVVYSDNESIADMRGHVNVLAPTPTPSMP
jgi:RHS repeat-associated protein